CQVLHNTLLQINKEAYINIETDQTNEEFKHLSIITGDYEKSIIFREQNMGLALKRRAVAVHNAKVSKFHLDNGSDIRKMLKSQRKSFRELLEKEFDKREQFKFALCSLTKFFIDDKLDNKDKKKNT
ncbi:1437_t:CDS:1, partial [Gigaspora margarita]